MWVIFAVLDPDPDPIRIRIRSPGYRSFSHRLEVDRLRMRIEISLKSSYILGCRCGGRSGELKYKYAAVSMFSQDIVTVYTALLERLW